MAVNKNTWYYVASHQFIPVLNFNNLNQAKTAGTEVALPIMIRSWKIHISCMNPAESIWWTICVRTHKNYTPSVVSFLLRLPTLSSLYYLTIYLPHGLCLYICFYSPLAPYIYFSKDSPHFWKELVYAFNLRN